MEAPFYRLPYKDLYKRLTPVGHHLYVHSLQSDTGLIYVEDELKRVRRPT